MDGNQILISFCETQALLKATTVENIDNLQWKKAWSQFEEIAQSILCKVDGNEVLAEPWRLDIILKLSNELDKWLQFLKENQGNHLLLIADVSVHLLNILCGNFEFCRIAGEGCIGQSETENLASLFKVSYQNIKDMLDLLETCTSKIDTDQFSFLCGVINCLVKCSQILADIDIMASVTIWKCIKRLFTLHKDLFLINYVHFNCLFDLCDLTRKTFTTCFDLMLDKEIDMLKKYQKVIRFFLGIVLLLTKEFKNAMIEKASAQVYSLINKIQELSLSETRDRYRSESCSAEYEGLYNTLLCVYDPLIKQFIECEGSAPSLLRNLFYIKGNRYKKVVSLMDLLNILDALTENTDLIDQWMESYVENCDDSNNMLCNCLLHVLFSCVEQCSASLFLQWKDDIVMDKSKCLKEGSLYEIIVARSCAFLSTLPPKYFRHVEMILLHNVLIDSKYSAILAADLWCFISRSGKADLCLRYFLFLGKTLVNHSHRTRNNIAIQNISSLFRRLFWFLEDNQHDHIVSSFPINLSNIAVWKLLPFSNMKVRDRTVIYKESLKLVLSVMNCKEKNHGQLIIYAIQYLSQLVSEKESHADVFINFKQNINDHVVQFWLCFTDRNEDLEISEPLVVAMMDLTSMFIPFMEGKCIYEVLSSITGVLLLSGSPSYQLGCTRFLTSLQDITFPSEYQSDCLGILKAMFNYLLSNENWVINDSCMNTLHVFAESTPYSNSLVTFLPSSRKKEFTQYLKKQACLIDYIQDEKLLCNVMEYLSDKCENIKNITNHKADSSNHELQIVNIISKMEEDVKQLDDIAKRNVDISNHVSRLRNVISIIENVCN